jgi:hypothetical protein
MNYDALLVHRTMRDLLFFVIKYPGWNIGSARWMAAMATGAKHAVTPGQQLSDYEKMSLQLGLGLFVNTGIYSALLYWGINGRAPEDISELYFKGVWTGGYTKSGQKEYISPASYWRELRAWTPYNPNKQEMLGFAPEKIIETIKAKGADIWRIPSEILDNKEAYSRKQLWDPSSPVSIAKGLGGYLGKQAIPYSFRQMYDAESGWGKCGGLVGLPRTAQRLTDTPARAELRRYYEDRRPAVVTVADQAKRGAKRDVMDLAQPGQEQEFMEGLNQARAEGKLTSQQYKQMREEGREVMRDPHWGPLRNSFKHLDLGEALKVYGLADPEEKWALHRQMAKKWAQARPETRRQHREEFNALREAAGQ